MRLKLTHGEQSGWIAGDPAVNPALWTQTMDESWLPSRLTGFAEEAGWVRSLPTDDDGKSIEVTFGVQRTFESAFDLAEWLIAYKNPETTPHPWKGTALFRWDDEEGGSIDYTASNCVLRMTAPIERVGGVSVILRYALNGGVTGTFPTYTPPTIPDVVDHPWEYNDSDYDYDV